MRQVPLQQEQARIAEIVLGNGSHGLCKPQASSLHELDPIRPSARS